MEILKRKHMLKYKQTLELKEKIGAEDTEWAI